MRSALKFLVNGIIISVIAAYIELWLFPFDTADPYAFSILVREGLCCEKLYDLFFLEVFILFTVVGWIYYICISILYKIFENRINQLLYSVIIRIGMFDTHGLKENNAEDGNVGTVSRFFLIQLPDICALFFICLFSAVIKNLKNSYETVQDVFVFYLIFYGIWFIIFYYVFGCGPVRFFVKITDVIQNRLNHKK